MFFYSKLPFNLDNLIGEGTYGKVYRMDQQVVKIFNEPFSFFNELVCYLNFDHPCIYKLDGYGTNFLVLPFGMNIFEALQQGMTNIDQIINDLSSCVNYLYRSGYVHYDIKPENLIFNLETHRVMLIDFGLTKQILLDDLTPPKVGYTIPYRDPEFIPGKFNSIKAELYSISKTLFYLNRGNELTGVEFTDKYIKEKEVPEYYLTKEDVNNDKLWNIIQECEVFIEDRKFFHQIFNPPQEGVVKNPIKVREFDHDLYLEYAFTEIYKNIDKSSEQILILLSIVRQTWEYCDLNPEDLFKMARIISDLCIDKTTSCNIQNLVNFLSKVKFKLENPMWYIDNDQQFLNFLSYILHPEYNFELIPYKVESRTCARSKLYLCKILTQILNYNLLEFETVQKTINLDKSINHPSDIKTSNKVYQIFGLIQSRKRLCEITGGLYLCFKKRLARIPNVYSRIFNDDSLQ